MVVDKHISEKSNTVLMLAALTSSCCKVFEQSAHSSYQSSPEQMSSEKKQPIIPTPATAGCHQEILSAARQIRSLHEIIMPTAESQKKCNLLVSTFLANWSPIFVLQRATQYTDTIYRHRVKDTESIFVPSLS